jgi:hypothetical protein
VPCAVRCAVRCAVCGAVRLVALCVWFAVTPRPSGIGFHMPVA